MNQRISAKRTALSLVIIAVIFFGSTSLIVNEPADIENKDVVNTGREEAFSTGGYIKYFDSREEAEAFEQEILNGTIDPEEAGMIKTN